MKFLFFFILLIPLWAQEPSEPKDIEVDVDQINKDRQRGEHKEFNKFGDDLEQNLDETLNDLASMKTINEMPSLSTEQSRKELVKLLQSRPLKNISHDDVRVLIQEKFQGTPTAEIFKKSPETLNLLVNVVKDDEALPQFSKIILDDRKWIWSGGSFLVVMIIIFLIKRKIKNPFKSIPLMFMHWLFLNLLFIPITMFCSLLNFYLWYPKEVGPLAKLVISSLPKIIKELT
jgi:hypothetical protein